MCGRGEQKNPQKEPVQVLIYGQDANLGPHWWRASTLDCLAMEPPSIVEAEEIGRFQVVQKNISHHNFLMISSP